MREGLISTISKTNKENINRLWVFIEDEEQCCLDDWPCLEGASLQQLDDPIYDGVSRFVDDEEELVLVAFASERALTSTSKKRMNLQ